MQHNTQPTKRVRRSQEQWRKVIEQYQANDLSGPKFCAEHDISYASFSKWKQRLLSQPAESTSAPFIELTPTPVTHSRWHIELDLGSGIQLRIAQPG